jgi:hypothetical protein
MSNGDQVDIQSLLSAADAKHGFPPGLMAAVLQQEVGNRPEFLTDPTKYHYEKGADGKRIAGHTGKASSAFGPFGILEDSTAKDPGFGVAPLKSKDLSEQVRFAAEYLAARAKAGGSLEAGLAGYGEGDKYSKQVLGRLGKGGGGPRFAATPAAAPTEVAARQEAVSTPVDVVVDAAPGFVRTPGGGGASGPNPWTSFLASLPQERAKPVQATDLNYGGLPRMAPAQLGPPMVVPGKSHIAAFKGWKAKLA